MNINYHVSDVHLIKYICKHCNATHFLCSNNKQNNNLQGLEVLVVSFQESEVRPGAPQSSGELFYDVEYGTRILINGNYFKHVK